MKLLVFLLLVGCSTPKHINIPPDGPDTTQKHDPIEGYNFGTQK